MAFKGNIVTKVISGGAIAIQLLSSSLPSFGYDSLRNPDSYFDRFGDNRPSVVAYVNKVISTTPDVYVINLEQDKGVEMLLAANTPVYQNDYAEIDRFTQEEFYKQVEMLGIDREKPASEYTDEEISKIVELLPRRFEDLTGGEWYIRDLAIMVAKGIINGYGKDGKVFAGGQVVTRGEFWAMIGRLEGILDQRENFKKYGYYCTPVGLKPVIRQLTHHKTIKDMHKEWWFPYYYCNKTICFGTYGVEDMKQPIYRGEVAVLVGEKFCYKEGWNQDTIRIFGRTRYYNDVPTKFVSIEQAGKGSTYYDLMDRLNVSIPSYYPPFQDVVKGTEQMTERVVIDINYLNHAGIMCGMPDSTSGWNKQLTRAEAMAVIARAYRPQQRLPVAKRMKDKSELAFNPGDMDNPEVAQLIKKTIEESRDSDTPSSSSGTELIDRTKPTYYEDFTEEEKIEWFENSLGFIRENDIIYEENMTTHFNLLKIIDGKFEFRHELWLKRLKEELNIQFNPEGLEKYRNYINQIGVPA